MTAVVFARVNADSLVNHLFSAPSRCFLFATIYFHKPTIQGCQHFFRKKSGPLLVDSVFAMPLQIVSNLTIPNHSSKQC